MSKKCKTCENIIPNWVELEGKKRNLSGRKFCFECSPFGQHNTRQLDRVAQELTAIAKVCVGCNRVFSSKKQRFCGSCNFRKQKNKRIEKLYSIVGTACWYCHYDKGLAARAVLEFHHVDPKTKCFNVSMREIATLKWDRVLEEAQKCVLLCCRCHREEQAGLIKKEEIDRLFKEKW